MGLFQQSVLKKHLNDLNKEHLNQAWQLFKTHFHNPAIQQHIRDSKEEEYQEGFVRDLFVNILGYTLKPQPHYNFELEKKTEADATKSDGALLRAEQIIGVVELKDTSATELDKVEKQVFGYKHKHKNCVYVITSNFEKLRFYIHDAIDFEEFNLFALTQERFAILYLCLQQQHIQNDVPLKMKQASLAEEENITKKLYADYSNFKNLLFQNITALNPQYNKLDLFQKTQKLLDRFLFILFAEDRLLVPPNSVRDIIKQWEQLKELDNYVPLFERFKKYFGYLNTGYEGKQYEIFAYNGGLFAADEILDNIIIDDTLLYNAGKTLSNYDFESEVDVNILGHIFEHSLSEIEEVQAELEGKTVEKTKTKRKKDGVFYTPRYITKYIVENTVGELCKQKKEELEITEETFSFRRRKDQKREKLYQQLKDYRQWLFSLTICDPACGSGAFLNQALEFLIAEHRYIDELKAKFLGDAMLLSDVEGTILENNLFGVDINEEAVEIARLSLWLRTARKGRKLNDLSKNIKCGNSLIDDPAIAGVKAFNWQKEFASIFEKGGFDVVIGNPPYLRVQGLRENFKIESKYYESKYESATGRFDIYVLFFEKAFSLINKNGFASFILPHKFMTSSFGHGIRKFIISNKSLQSIISFGHEIIFEDASTYTCIIILRKKNTEINYKEVTSSELFGDSSFNKISYSTLDEGFWNFNKPSDSLILQKIKSQPTKAINIFEAISQGIVTVSDEIFMLKGEIIGNEFVGFSEKMDGIIKIEKNAVRPILKGEDIQRYEPLNTRLYVIYLHFEKEGKTHPIPEDILKDQFPKTYSYLEIFKSELIQRKLKYKTNPSYWYSMHRSREISIFEKPKLIMRNFSFGSELTIDFENCFFNANCYGITLPNNSKEFLKLYLSILNSTLSWFYMKRTSPVIRGGYVQYKTTYVEGFPFPSISDSLKDILIAKADIMLAKTKELQELKQKLLQLLQSNFPAVQVNKKLEQWPSLSFADLLKELSKQKIKPTLPQQAEWMNYFEEQKTKANAIKTMIEATDKEIDLMVYELYGLTEEEKKIVEGS